MCPRRPARALALGAALLVAIPTLAGAQGELDRLFKADRLFYYEKRGMAGARFELRHAGFQLRGGYAFDRYYFIGDDYSDRRHNRVDVDGGPFMTAGMSVRF